MTLCGKIIYTSAKMAHNALASVRRRHMGRSKAGGKRAETTYYYCTACAGYHLTSSRKK